MTVIRILLILGSVYIALKQKKESTRNLILVATGLLAFCMMGKEGLTQIAAVVASCGGTADEIPATCTGTNSNDQSDCALATTWTSGDQSDSSCPTAEGCVYGAASTPTCDLDAATDGSDACPAGCSSVAASAARTEYDDVDCTKNKIFKTYNATGHSCDLY